MELLCVLVAESYQNFNRIYGFNSARSHYTWVSQLLWEEHAYSTGLSKVTVIFSQSARADITLGCCHYSDIFS